MASRSLEQSRLLDCFVAKARLCDRFDDECREIVENLFVTVRRFPKDVVFLHENDHASTVYLLCSGWAARVVQLADGNRQITELFLPGDIFPVHASLSHSANSANVVSLVDCEVCSCPSKALTEASASHLRLSQTLWWLSLRDVGILRMWMAINGQYKAYPRLAHLFCELAYRLEQAGIATAQGFELPLTQSELGEIVGLTVVHINRTLGKLKEDGLVEKTHGRVEILDRKTLEVVAGFDPAYLTPP